jgi:hypothetical protein
MSLAVLPNDLHASYAAPRSCERPRATPRNACILFSALLIGSGIAGCDGRGGSGEPAAWATIDRYCIDCHDSVERTAGLAFDAMSPESIDAHPEVFERALRKLRGRMMPPAGGPAPSRDEYDALVSFLEARLDAAAEGRPSIGYVGLKRLNRTEYGNAIRDLFGIEIDSAELLPRDGQSAGFDNIADTLGESPTFVEQYVAAAEAVAAMAVGNLKAKFESRSYDAVGEIHQSGHAPGMPLGTRGGIAVDHDFPVDGEYRLSIKGLVLGDYTPGLEYRHTALVLIDDVEVYRQDIGGEEDLRYVDQHLADALAELNEPLENILLDVTAGRHRVAVTFVARSLAESDIVLSPFVAGGGDERIMAPRRIEIAGPLRSTSLSATPSRKRIFVCRPELEADETACAERIFTSIARRAYRRALAADDLEGPMRFFAEGRALEDFENGIRRGLVAILASPKFLYRAEAPPADIAPGAAYRIGPVELASRLSFFLWSSLPDDELLDLAAGGQLADPGVLRRQARRMLADERAKALVSNFAAQWLALRDIERSNPDPALFPHFDRELRNAFGTELTLFLESILLADRSVLELLDAEHTFVNERLALHYGLATVQGSRFRKVTLTDPNRRGLLGKAGIQMITSYPNRTSPVLRGAWILEHLTGTPPAQPPPNVEAFPETEQGAPAVTVRARLEAHRESPTCSGCHGVLDPLGFALENFDAVGAWRDLDLDARDPIDAAGVLADGTPVSSAQELSEALLARPDLLVQTLTEKLMTFALGRPLEYYDMPAVRAIVRSAEQQGYRFASIVDGIVASDAFLLQRIPEQHESGGVVADVRH